MHVSLIEEKYLRKLDYTHCLLVARGQDEIVTCAVCKKPDIVEYTCQK